MVSCHCSNCFKTFDANTEFSGKRVRCPYCQQAVLVPKQLDTRKEPTPPEEELVVPEESITPKWVTLGAAFVIAIAVSATLGLIAGHRSGKSDHKGEVVEAQNYASDTAQQLKTTEGELAVQVAKRKQEKERFEATIHSRDAEAVRLKGLLKTAEEKAAGEIAAGAKLHDEAEGRATARKKEEADIAEAKKKEGDRIAEAKQKTDANRAKPAASAFKDFVNFPEEYTGKCLRFDDIWLHGGFTRIDDTRAFSATVSSRDGKLVFSKSSISKFTSGVVFVLSEEMGRPLSLVFENDIKYGSNLCCEVTKSAVGEKLYIAYVYRVETLTVENKIKNTYEDK